MILQTGYKTQTGYKLIRSPGIGDWDGCVKYVDFSDLNSLVLETGIAKARDKSHKGDVTQTTPANQPALLPNAQNGLSVANFNGSTHFMRYPDFGVSNSFTLYVVASLGNYVEEFQHFVSADGWEDGHAHLLAYRTFQKLNFAQKGRVPGPTYSNSLFPLNIFKLIEIKVTQSVVAWHINGVADGSFVVTTPLTYKLSPGTIGNWDYVTLQRFLTGKIGEVLIFNRTLLSAEETYLRNYFINKWAL